MAEKFQETGAILKNERIADGMFWLQAKAPEIARHARPGQFVHVRVTGPSVQFLRMPFAVYDVTGRQDVVDICYQVLGEGTRQLSGLSCGDELDLIGLERDIRCQARAHDCGRRRRPRAQPARQADGS